VEAWLKGPHDCAIVDKIATAEALQSSERDLTLSGFVLFSVGSPGLGTGDVYRPPLRQ